MIDAAAFTAWLDGTGLRMAQAAGDALDEARGLGIQSLTSTGSFKNRTGRLRTSFRSYGDGMRGSDDLERTFGTSVFYGYFLEFGTVKISPRRFGQTARDLVEANLYEITTRHLGRAIDP